MNVEEFAKQHPGKVVEDSRFLHTMALSLNPINLEEGVIRCILDRQGDLVGEALIDTSKLYKIKSTDGLEHFAITDPLVIQGLEETVSSLKKDGWKFIGLEDPDIIVDEGIHLFFTIAFSNKDGTDYRVHLGHAAGQSLDSMVMTQPVLSPTEAVPWGAKELSLAPRNSKGVYLNLIESKEYEEDNTYFVVRVGIAKELSTPWEYGDIVFHPKESKYSWCAEQASPGPLLPQSFIDVGKNKRVGLLNGREASVIDNGKIRQGMFSVGLMIYNFEEGEIEWVSKEPLIKDSDATTVTFTSSFVETQGGEGILYAHVDDSFVRAYTLYADKIKELIK